MHIVVLNSSYRGKKGVTGFLSEKLAEGFSKAQASYEIITMAEKRIMRCQACDVCQTESQRGRCIYQGRDDVDAIYQAIAAADRVVYATPVYIFGISGLLKIFLDRLYAYGEVRNLQISNSGLFFHENPEDICSTPFVTLSCCNNFESRTTRNSHDFFEAWSQFHDAPRVGTLVLRSANILFKSSAVPDARKTEIFETFVQAGYELGRDGKISPKTQRRANREIIPMPFFRFFKRFRGVKKQVLSTTLQRIAKAKSAAPQNLQNINELSPNPHVK